MLNCWFLFSVKLKCVGTCSEGFRGFLLEGRKYSNDEYILLGSFSKIPNDTAQSLQCGVRGDKDNAVTNKDDDIKNSIYVTWTVPASLQRDIYFR